MGYRIYDTDGTFVTESKGKAKWTHAVVVDAVVETYERELADTVELMDKFIASGSRTQNEADQRIARAQQSVDWAKTVGVTAISTHKSYETAVKGIDTLRSANGYGGRFTNPRIVEVEQI